MLRLAGYAAAVLVLLIVALLAVAASKPNSFTVSRSIVIAAPPEKITPLIADFHNWALWSPWEHLDPNMQKTFTGPPAGVGAVYEWQGNSKAGAGRMEILSATAISTGIKLDFIKPFRSSMNSDFVLAPTPDGTRVTWSMFGPQKLVPSKVMSLFVTMDKMVGPDFERGLAGIKTVAEH
jgi:hypothetical protein